MVLYWFEIVTLFLLYSDNLIGHSINFLKGCNSMMSIEWVLNSSLRSPRQEFELPYLTITQRRYLRLRTCHNSGNRWLPNSAVRVRARVKSCGICGGQNDTGAGFLRVLRFPLPIVPMIAAHSSSSIIRDWCNRPNGGRCDKWAQTHLIPKH
jgi:hypothetical protein